MGRAIVKGRFANRDVRYRALHLRRHCGPALIAATFMTSLGGPTDAAAQSVRGWVGSNVQLVELRPVAPAPGGCVPDVPCYETLSEVQSIAATQDLSLTAWGFGVQGLSATVLLRGRARLGSDYPWPRVDDRFDALLAYAQLVRDRLTVRLGRQEIRSGLGFPSFDGASAAWLGGTGSWRVEAYGGRSLARGLREPVREALRGIESFVPDHGVALFGGSARARLQALSLTARYQREILTDRSQLASDRGSLDLTYNTPWGRLLASLDYDFARGSPGKGEVTWSSPLAGGRWLVEASAFRYVPYFSLSTIWGFFEPVAYHGVLGRAAWSPSAAWGVWGSVGARRYGDAGTVVVLRPLADHGWRSELGARWQAGERWAVDARYDVEWGPGGFLHSVDTSARFAVSGGIVVGASLMSFQQIEQFRLGDGRGLGGGLTADLELSSRFRLAGGASLLRHTSAGDGALNSPWNQTRAWSSLTVLLGDDPGLASRRRR